MILDKNIKGVYFIMNKSNGLIKIGCSKDIKNRFNQLKNQLDLLGIESDIELIDYIQTENYKQLENEIHNKLSIYNYKNEWYKINIEIINKIKNTKFNLLDETINFNNYSFVSEDLKNVDIEFAERGVFSVLCDFCCEENNNVIINNEIPTYKQISDKIGMSERNFRRYIKTLENNNLIKCKKFGFGKSIFINPKYFCKSKKIKSDIISMFK